MEICVIHIISSLYNVIRNMSLFRLDGVCTSKFHWEECAIYISYLPSACSRVAFFMLSLSACPYQTACSNAAGPALAGGGGHRYA